MDVGACSVIVVAGRPALVAVVIALRQGACSVRVHVPMRSVAREREHGQRGRLDRQPQDQEKKQESSGHGDRLQQAAMLSMGASQRKPSNEDKVKPPSMRRRGTDIASLPGPRAGRAMRSGPPDGELSMAHQQFESCISACNACAAACDHCATACLKEDDVRMMARCVALEMDCAAICRLAAGFMARGSEFANQVCALCASICEACGQECAKHQHDHCQACAQACKRCADECRRMAGAR